MKFSALLLILFVSVVSGAEEELPQVLIIGDAVYREPVQSAAKELKGKVKLVHATAPAGEVLHTGISAEVLDDLLGDADWDLIHFNFGLGDLVYRAPGMKSIRVLPIDAGGVRMTSAFEYETNLRAIVARLKKTGVDLVWASTTPIFASSTGIFKSGSEVEYNAIAAKIMAEQDVPIHDMHTYVRNLFDSEKSGSPGGDPFSFNKKPLHPALVEVILNQLSIQ